ncbi:hypothetical protein BKI52_01420 [marine bacterium AO1-C]|nr:hypothetical protein BKI52_01420 [marine bacterium AO1-C]
MNNYVIPLNITVKKLFYFVSALFITTQSVFSQDTLNAHSIPRMKKKRDVKLIKKTHALKVFSVKELRKDLQVLHQAFKEAHPGFYWYTNKTTFEQKFDSIQKLLVHPMNELAFYRLVRPLVVDVNCGHTQLYTSLKFRNHFRKKSRYFPLKLKFIDNKAYIQQNFSKDSTVQLGLEVVSINGQSMREVIQSLFRYTPSDGYNTTYKYRILDQDFSSYYPFYINAKVDTFQVACRTISGNVERKYKLASVSRRDYRRAIRGFKGSEKPALDFRVIGEEEEEIAGNSRANNDELLKKARVGILTIRSFQNNTLRKQGFSFSQYMRNIFRVIRKKKIKNLIIDLRENSGGTVRNGILLYSYLTRRKFKYFNYEKVTTNRPYTFMRYVNTYRSRMVNNKLLVKTDSGYYISNKLHYNLKTHRPSKNHYKRNLYVLINGRSFSATTQFASLVHSKKRATFVGEETGGGYKGCTAGRTCYINLPNTKMRLKIPLIKYSNAVAQGYSTKGHGIIPDYELQPTITDLLKGVDTELEYTLDLIRKQMED